MSSETSSVTMDDLKEEEPVPLPSAPRMIDHDHNCIIQPPLTRRGVGPLLMIIIDDSHDCELGLREHIVPHGTKQLEPMPSRKWAEEGYLVAEFTVNQNPYHDDYLETFVQDFLRACNNFRLRPDCDQTSPKIGVISYGSGHSVIRDVIGRLDCIGAIVCYDEPLRLSNSKPVPQLVHLSGEIGNQMSIEDPQTIQTYTYPGAKHHFMLPHHPNHHPSHSAIAHTRTLAFLKPLLGGPYFDLEAIWDEHAKYEFEDRSVAKTMATMVDEPYVNHIPTMTGGIGRANLTRFYEQHFIHNNPPDAGLQLVSRTVGIDRVVDEFVFECTHTKTIDWLIPGIPPTNKPLRIPFTSVVNIRGDRLCHEHISWDQATVLVQLGLMPEYLPFPYPINGQLPSPGKKFVYKVPAAGVETAQKLVDESAVESNGMFGCGVREVDV